MTQMLQLSCIVCQKPIPEKRAMQRSNTCEQACRSKLKAFYRYLSTLRKCRHCNKPSSQAERSDFAAWKRERAKQARAESKAATVGA